MYTGFTGNELLKIPVASLMIEAMESCPIEEGFSDGGHAPPINGPTGDNARF